MTQVPIGHDLIARLLEAFPGIVVGIKDSAGQLDHMAETVARFPELAVLAGADPLMLPLLQAGGAGCITATSNLRSDSLRVVWDAWNDPARAAEVEEAQARINDWRTLTNSYTQLPTVKAMLAKRRGDTGWRRVLPPLVELGDAECRDVWARMEGLGE